MRSSITSNVVQRPQPTDAFWAAVCLTLVLVVFGACGRSGIDFEDEKEVRNDKSLIGIIEEASGDSYDPPSDGKITEKQIKMYLQVKKREQDLVKMSAQKSVSPAAKVPPFWEEMETLGDLGKLLTADIRAAQELGYNTTEYQWVKGKVIEAKITSRVTEVRSAGSAMFRESLESLKGTRAQTRDPALQRMYDEQIVELERSLRKAEVEAAEKQEDPAAKAVRHNVDLLEKYKNELDALQEERNEYQEFQERNQHRSLTTDTEQSG